MKYIILAAAAVALAGCENMPQRAHNPNFVPLPTGAALAAQQQQYFMPIQQQQRQAPRQPMSCTSRFVGNTQYTDCY